MKQEIKDITVAAVNQVPGVAGYLTTGQLIVLVLTIVLLCLQIGYYAHKWWMAATGWGVKMRKGAERLGLTGPAPLDEV